MSKSHLQRVADYGHEHGCIVCGEPFAHVHHVLAGRTPGRKIGSMLTLPLCVECHTGSRGIHGDRTRWTLAKMDEMKALDEVLEGIYGDKNADL